MKTIKQIFKVLAILLLVISCDANEYDTPPSFTDLAFTTTFGSSTLREGEVNRYISFMDMSAGATYHEWRIPKTAFFLKGPIPNNLDNHDAFIINPGDTVSTDKTVHVLFKKGDSNTVIELYNEFADSTWFVIPSYWDVDLKEIINDTIRTENIDGKWVASYPVVLDVYDTLAPDLQLIDMAENVLTPANDTLVVKFEDELIIKDLTGIIPDNNARPTSTTFRVKTIEENEEDVVNAFNSKKTYLPEDFEANNTDTVTFNKSIGFFNVEIVSQRERTETLRGQTATYVSPIVIKVEPLEEELSLKNQAKETATDEIQFSVTSKLQTVENIPATSFDVKVDGVSQTISRVELAANQTLLTVVLDTPLEPADAAKTVTLSYDGTGGLISLDERMLQAFTDEPIEVYVPTPINQVGEITESSDDFILIEFDEGIDAATVTSASNAADGFSVTLNGNSFAIQNVSVDVANPKILKLEMVDKLYQDDVITVAYTHTAGEIKSLGGGSLSDFAATTIQPYFEYVLNDSFEGALGTYWVEGASGTGATVAFSTEQAATGSQSVKMTNDKPRLESGANLTYDNGATYVFTYKRYIVGSSVTLDANTEAKQPGDKFWFDSSSGATAVTPRWYETPGVAPVVDTWVEVMSEFTPDTDLFNKKVRMQPVPTSDFDFTVYYDDFKIYKKDTRN